MHKVKIKPLKVFLIIWIAVACCIILLGNIILFSFFHLSSLQDVNEWKYYVIENINSKIGSEPFMADYELINVVYDKLVVPYARARVTFQNDKEYAIAEIENIALNVTKSADRIFGGKPSVVKVTPPAEGKKSIVIEVKKPCLSWFAFISKKTKCFTKTHFHRCHEKALNGFRFGAIYSIEYRSDEMLIKRFKKST